MPKEIWWKGMKVKPVQKSIYLCYCPDCEVPFTVPEDLPEREEFFGIDVFVVYCPICSQKLRFSIDDTPTTCSLKH